MTDPAKVTSNLEKELPAIIRVRAAGKPSTITTVEEALFFIDRDVNPELAQLPRWTFARALIEEAIKTGKSRDIKAAFRQLKQALGNEKWLDQSTGQAARK